MIHVIITAHGGLASELLKSAVMIGGEESSRGVTCLNMTEGKSVEQFCLEAQEALAATPQSDYLILADVFGASPCNSCLMVFRNASYRIITGVNLPMLLELFTIKDTMDLEGLWESLIKSGKESVRGVFIENTRSEGE